MIIYWFMGFICSNLTKCDIYTKVINNIHLSLILRSYIRTFPQKGCAYSPNANRFTYIHVMHTHSHTCMYTLTFTQVHTSICIRIHTCMYIIVHACIHTYIHRAGTRTPSANLIVIFSSPATFFLSQWRLHYDFTNKDLKKSQKPINRAFLLVERHNNLLPTSGTDTDVWEVRQANFCFQWE